MVVRKIKLDWEQKTVILLMTDAKELQATGHYDKTKVKKHQTHLDGH